MRPYGLKRVKEGFSRTLFSYSAVGLWPSSVRWTGSPKRYIHIKPPEPVNVALFEKRIFADTITLRIWRWDHPELSGWAWNPMTSILIREWQGRTSSKGSRGQFLLCLFQLLVAVVIPCGCLTTISASASRFSSCVSNPPLPFSLPLTLLCKDFIY